MRWVLFGIWLAVLMAILTTVRSSAQQASIEVAVAKVALVALDLSTNELSIADGTNRVSALTGVCDEEKADACGGTTVLHVMSGPIGIEGDPLATGIGIVYSDVDFDGVLDYVTVDGASQPLTDELRLQYAALVAKLAASL